MEEEDVDMLLALLDEAEGVEPSTASAGNAEAQMETDMEDLGKLLGVRKILSVKFC